MLGIDIGNNEIKITARKGDTIRMVSEKLPTNLVKDGVVQLQDAMADFIKNIRKKYKLPGGDCSLILPPSQVFCRHIHFPVMEEERLRINLPYEMRDYLSGESDRYFYDYLVDDVPKDESGAPMGIETTAAAVLKTTVVENSLMMQSAGLKLTTAIPQEMAYRNLLMQNPGRVFTPGEIYTQVWKEKPLGSESTVAVHIRHLREKIEINPSDPRYIKVVFGQGYRMEGDRKQ